MCPVCCKRYLFIGTAPGGGLAARFAFRWVFVCHDCSTRCALVGEALFSGSDIAAPTVTSSPRLFLLIFVAIPSSSFTSLCSLAILHFRSSLSPCLPSPRLPVRPFLLGIPPASQSLAARISATGSRRTLVGPRATHGSRKKPSALS